VGLARLLERLTAATPLKQTCSAGLAAWDHHESAADLTARSDRALYDAKRAGRGRVCAARPQPAGA
jgi:GGDEF domain-containing protein